MLIDITVNLRYWEPLKWHQGLSYASFGEGRQTILRQIAWAPDVLKLAPSKCCLKNIKIGTGDQLSSVWDDQWDSTVVLFKRRNHVVGSAVQTWMKGRPLLAGLLFRNSGHFMRSSAEPAEWNYLGKKGVEAYAELSCAYSIQDSVVPHSTLVAG